MRTQNIFQIFAVTIIALVQLVFILSFTWTVIPTWQSILEKLQWNLWLFDIFLAVLIAYKIFRSIWQSRAEKSKTETATSLLFWMVGLVLTSFLIFGLFGAIALKHFTGFYCGEKFESVEFPAYQKTVYLITTGCHDGIVAGGSVYIHEGRFPLMEKVFEIEAGYFDSSAVKQNGDLVRITGTFVASEGSSTSQVLLYNLETGESKITVMQDFD